MPPNSSAARKKARRAHSLPGRGPEQRAVTRPIRLYVAAAANVYTQCLFPVAEIPAQGRGTVLEAIQLNSEFANLAENRHLNSSDSA